MKRMMKFMSAAVLALALTACGSAHSSAAEPYAAEETAYDGEYGLAVSNSFMADGDYAPMEEPAAAYDSTEDEPEIITGEKLVYTGSVNLETLQYEDTVAAVQEYIKRYNGIIEQQNEWDSDRSWTYTDGRKRMSNRTLSMTVRIPTESFDSFMNDMDGAGKVTARSQSVENISRRYNDNSIEIEALRKQQERLLEMMDKAETVEEMIQVESRLSEVQVALNRDLSYQAGMDTDVKYSTIYLNISEVQEYTPADNDVPIGGFWKRLTAAAENSWKSFVYFLQNAVILLIRLLPYFLLAALIIFGVKQYRKAKGLDTKLIHRKPKAEKKPLLKTNAADETKPAAEPETNGHEEK